ncbi:MAG: alpha-galactosidase [Bifidobacteriaceae bacterium]|jgi:alpha-galactosidase|nr:alpha-galactosidase [Bifidobacteriaceae bacterium]MCI1914985.1 alpha-galactosidase [Bifidobacteriaceae bacterium]
MPITYNKRLNQFHLCNDSLSYIIEIREHKYVTHVYYGKRIESFDHAGAYPDVARASFSPNPAGFEGTSLSLNTILQECPGTDTGDYREGLAEFTFADGTTAFNFTYDGYEIRKGKEPLPGLPSTYVEGDDEADTLVLSVSDTVRKVGAQLTYTIYRARPVVTRSVSYVNNGTAPVRLDKALSMCVDFDDADFDLLQMPGEWASEKQLKRDHLSNGVHVLESRRGASSVAQQPFMALMRPHADEFQGDVYGFHFVYSGNFRFVAQVDPFQQTRVLGGINPFNFGWRLEAGQRFQTPEMVMVYTDSGLNAMSQAFHDLYRRRLARGEYRDAQRPVLINNWETTYFDFDEERILALAKKAKAIGVEQFVLDDGWFGHRDDDHSSLGDWVTNERKLPHGLKHLAEAIEAEGLKFGLWFEPEMISEDSDLFRAHPDWHLHVPGYPSSKGRDQLILDFSRQEVRDEIFAQMTAILDEVPVSYIKWDMNRNMTEVGSAGRSAHDQLQTSHRYILGLYEFLDRLTKRYPHILFENCSGGAGRFDPGMSYYMPQSWTSDNTDSFERLRIQHATSMIFPPVMMCAQLSESPNDQVGRITSLSSRAAVSMSANFGIMMDLTRKSQAELDELATYISAYKEVRSLVQFGDFYRLLSPFDGNYGCWEFVDAVRTRGRLMFFQVLSHASKPWVRLRLRGLERGGTYEVAYAGSTRKERFSGAELMEYGLYLNHDLEGDFAAKVVDFSLVEGSF